ncbi:MAG: hypothetical protein IPP49_09485 [Saprospiraceae bacterium]|nr:hypothetical protein [Saprospiraceae bacterium]
MDNLGNITLAGNDERTKKHLLYCHHRPEPGPAYAPYMLLLILRNDVT